jgi:hypothetical protein
MQRAVAVLPIELIFVKRTKEENWNKFSKDYKLNIKNTLARKVFGHIRYQLVLLLF